jgi:cob(I)alamin adenosyltransferase
MSDADQDAQHREKMKAVQAEHRAKMKEKKRAEGGLLLVYTGNGKGKSTSAFGTVIRALGWGHSVAVVQYIKGTWKTGEREFFARFPDLLTWHAMGEGFTWDTQDRQRDRQAAEAAWAKSRAFLESGDYDLVLLDEINIALRYDQLSLEEVVEGVKARHPRTSVILTGRDAKPELLEMADLVTEMKQVRHPFEQGIKAKQGIDF